MNLIVTGNDTLVKTTNGGNTWQKLALPPIYEPRDLQFINIDLGWVTDYSNPYTLYKTTNGGVSWYQQAQPVYNFQFITAQIGWYTYGNQIFNSTNGGSTWTIQNSNTNNTLNDIFFIDTNNGWAVGQNGTILYTPNGGIPVELISFTATANINEVTLNWSTATETNNSGFEILRFAKNDNGEWNKIGFVPGHGTTTETQHYSFTDNDIKPGKYQYKLKQMDFDGTFEYSQILEVEIPIVNEFSLSQNYPNPFNPSTKIKYSIPQNVRQLTGNVSLKIYDVLGREIATLVNEEKPAGEYEVEFDGTALPSGIYFYQLKAGVYSETKKMILLK
ncbi:MAG: T9SS type A sorting domain-containing protein [bacterium]|nr:T9SS type A sorting domain-containing protein [bacterium]